jgi:hypothetical protein
MNSSASLFKFPSRVPLEANQAKSAYLPVKPGLSCRRNLCGHQRRPDSPNTRVGGSGGFPSNHPYPPPQHGFLQRRNSADWASFAIGLLLACLVPWLVVVGPMAGEVSAEFGLGPGGGVKAAEPEFPFEYFRNPWQVIGLKDYAHGTRVSPDGRLVLPDNRQVILRVGPDAEAIPRSIILTLEEGWLPIVRFQVTSGAVAYRVRYWATPLPHLSDWEKAFAWPVAGDSFTSWIEVIVCNPASSAEEAVVWLAILRGGNYHVQAARKKLLPGQSHGWAWRIDCHPPNLQLSTPQELSPNAELIPTPGADSCTASCFCPLPAEEPPAEAALWLERTRKFWTTLLQTGTRLEVPCSKAIQTLRAAHVCQLLASDHGQPHGGEGFYDELYIRDGAYQILHLLEAGFLDSAAQAIESFLRHQRSDGRFETQAGQLDANGQALWALWKYYRMTRDREFLRRVYPAMARAAEWVIQARRQEPPDSPFAGLLPPAVADGEYLWDGKHRIVGYDFWNLRGLLCVLWAAETLGLTQDCRRWEQEAQDYRRAIDRAWKLTGLPYFPPSWEKAGTPWGNTETLWPTELFNPQDPRVTATIHHLRTEYGGGYLEGTIRWIGHQPAIHPYMGAYTALASLRRGEVEDVLSDFFWYLLHSSASHAFPEGIYPETRTAWNNTIPHTLGAANYAILLRHMLIDERNDTLFLLPAIPSDWLAEGKRICIENALTEFGWLNFELQSTEKGLSGRIRAEWRQPGPKQVILTVPQGKSLASLEHNLGGVLVPVFTPTPKQSWSYERVVEEYLATAPPRLAAEIPHLLPLPVIPPPEADRCEPLDLRSIANTDPFAAPFGVPRPGKYLFTALSVGRLMLAGVPFEIIDPAANQGRGLVVLHSPQGAAANAFPKEVEIPVEGVARRIYFLGNVAGWTSRDLGTGPWSAIAEYRIIYADGTEQIIPLVLGRTVDDWAATPLAEEVIPVLQGVPWHLNLLAVKTQPKPLRKILFRDLGTPSSPLLAAITVER